MGLLETFRILRTVPDADVRRYLEIALIEPYEELQSMAFELLFEQENYDSPDVIVRNYTALLPSLRRRILERKRDFLPVAREQTRRGSEKARENAYRLIEEIGEGEVTKLLSEGVRDTSPSVRANSAEALEKVALRYHYHLVNYGARKDPESKQFLDENQLVLSQALEGIFLSYGIHRKSVFIDIVIESGVQYYSIVADVILARTNSPLYDAFRRSMNAATSASAMRLLFRLLQEPEERLRLVGERVALARRDPAFLIGLATHFEKLSPESFINLAKQTRDVPWWGALERNPEAEPKIIRKLIEFLAHSSVPAAGRDERLISLLLNPSGEIRQVILHLLHDIRSEKILSVAVQLLRDRDEGVSEAAAFVVQDINPDHMVEIFSPFLSSSHEGLRKIAGDVVGGVSFDRYFASFDSLDRQTQSLAGKAITKIDDGMSHRLRAEIQSLESNRRIKALKIARATEVTEELQPLLNELLGDPDRRVRATVIRMVELSGNLGAMKLVASSLQDPDRRVRANAVEAFEAVGDDRFIQILLPLQEDPDNRVRANTLKALWTLGHSGVESQLEEMLSHSEEMMRLSAVWALGETDISARRSLLEEQLRKEPSERVRKKIEVVLRRILSQGDGS